MLRYLPKKLIIQISIDGHEKLDDPLIEEKLLKNDQDCSSASKMLSAVDLFVPVASQVDLWAYLRLKIIDVSQGVLDSFFEFLKNAFPIVVSK